MCDVLMVVCGSVCNTESVPVYMLVSMDGDWELVLALMHIRIHGKFMNCKEK